MVLLLLQYQFSKVDGNCFIVEVRHEKEIVREKEEVLSRDNNSNSDNVNDEYNDNNNVTELSDASSD